MNAWHEFREAHRSVGQMFSNFANVWTVVGRARDLKRNAPFAMRVASEPVVFFLDAAGRARALVGQYPHRGVALSFDIGCFVRCSINDLELLNLGGLSGILVKARRRREAAAL